VPRVSIDNTDGRFTQEKYKLHKHIATSIGFDDVARVNASFLAPSEHWNPEEINDGTYLIPGLRVPAGSNPASVIELLNQIARLILTKAKEQAQKHPHTEDIRGSLAPWRVRRIITHVDANLDAALRVEDLARLTRLSLSHFCRAFRSSFGCSPHRFITHCRLERAKELMLRTDVPLLQIAIECGFADQPHFSRVFLRFVGISPARWRRVLAAPPEISCGSGKARRDHSDRF
jgi:AraC-like DNA-binding protein